MSVGPQALAVDKCLRNGITSLALSHAEHLAHNCGTGDLDEYNVVQSDLVEAVLQCHAALNFVCLDHGLQYVLDCQNLALSDITASSVGSADPVGHSEDGAQVVGGVTPLCGEPAVVEVEPTDHGTNVEGAIHRIELVRCTRDLGTIGYDGAGNDWAKVVGAVRELEGLETATEGVEEDEASSVNLDRNISKGIATPSWHSDMAIDVQQGQT